MVPDGAGLTCWAIATLICSNAQIVIDNFRIMKVKCTALCFYLVYVAINNCNSCKSDSVQGPLFPPVIFNQIMLTVGSSNSLIARSQCTPVRYQVENPNKLMPAQNLLILISCSPYGHFFLLSTHNLVTCAV